MSRTGVDLHTYMDADVYVYTRFDEKQTLQVNDLLDRLESYRHDEPNMDGAISKTLPSNNVILHAWSWSTYEEFLGGRHHVRTAPSLVSGGFWTLTLMTSPFKYSTHPV